ncbi:MAG: putative zinc-binding protein [Thermoguttaceae bacterium]
MAEAISKVGIISCSGEEIPEGTVARQAVRRVLEALRPQQTVTLCLPLFLAGEEGERRFAREHPTITVDGCSKLCAKRGTEKYSGRVSASLIVSDILGDRAKRCHRSTRDADPADEQAVWLVAERIAAEVDALAGSVESTKPSGGTQSDGACCACSKPSPDGKLEVQGKPVAVAGLPLIFQHLRKKHLEPNDDCGETLLKTLKIYHSIEASEEAGYRNALVTAYRAYCGDA